ncbi:MAG: TlpA family protein disulfide reductase [Oscillospiraceae bacterium]|nr:TlpA family protein disulfide reductase [Oscillospiraceae bacterium]
MSKTLKTVVWTLITVFVLIGAYFLYEKLSEEYMPQTNIQDEDEASKVYKAPDFEVYTNDGKAVRLSDFIGKPIVVNFWASWCPPCKAEMPDFEKAYKKYGEEIHFLMINSTGGRETLSTAKEFLQGVDYTFPVYFDTYAEAASIYGVTALPTTFFIDSEGNLVAHAMSMLSEELIEQGIGMIRNEQ